MLVSVLARGVWPNAPVPDLYTVGGLVGAAMGSWFRLDHKTKETGVQRAFRLNSPSAASLGREETPASKP